MERGYASTNAMEEMLEELHDFKEVVTFKMTGGWMLDTTQR
jgi:hypothetical protein